MASNFKKGERLPRLIPQWIKRRVEVDIFQIYDFASQAASAMPEGALVIDAGSGEGRFKHDFAHTRYVGVDLAIGDLSWDYRDLDAICDLARLPFAADHFDAALCFQVLEHTPEPGLVLKEIQRVLKPGGKLFLTAPQGWPQHQKPHDYYRYTSFGLRHLFHVARLSPVSIRNMGGYFWYLSWQFQALNFWLFPRDMRGRWLTWPLRLVFGIVFQLCLPLVLYYLDSLDRAKDETFGYLCIVEKPSG